LRAEAARSAGDSVEPAIQVWPQVQAEPGPEAAAIAVEIQRLRAVHPQWRIAVLVQTRSLAAPIQAALARADVPALGVDLVPLAERQVVRDLIAIGQALENAGNRSAWLAVLHASPCGLQLADLHQLCGEDAAVTVVERLADPAAWHGLDIDARLRLDRVAPLLLQAWQSRGRHDAASAIELLWRQLGGWQACRNDSERSAALQFLAAVRAAGEREGPLDGARLQELADLLRDHGSSHGENPVEILTIHHAKGLEWDVVFVPGLGRRSRGDQPPLLRWLELPAPAGASDLLLAVRSIGEASASDPLGRYIAGLQAARQDHERVRLVYVAVTRARQMLVLSGHAPWNRKLQRPVPRKRSALDILWPAIGAAFEALPAAADEQDREVATRLNLETPWYRLPAQFEPSVTRQALQPQGLGGSAPEAAVQPEYDWVGPLARATGTVLHAELERFAVNGMPTATELAPRVPGFIARLRESGISETTAAEAAARVVACLTRVLHDPRARWMLGTAHREARSEWRLSGIIDGRLRNAVIDRSFIDEGCRWVIDFKTGTHAGGGLDEFLQAERERYRAQLELYRRLASRTGPEPVRAALYYPWLGEFLEFG
ncbi:MAG TPA: 3'-5' exonuclease, partial [Steroidobacteraceae bacterium]|nr:3'-5' exonuclease [Steroidobacteraceae bacterium]